LIRIEALDLHLAGTLNANSKLNRGYSGGGAGGGISLVCRNFSSAQGAQLLAAGSGAEKNTCGDGGGGRIAVIYGEVYSPALHHSRLEVWEDVPKEFELEATAARGTGGYTDSDPSEDGTIRFVRVLPAPGTVLMVR
jgi:hypothetical protein